MPPASLVLAPSWTSLDASSASTPVWPSTRSVRGKASGSPPPHPSTLSPRISSTIGSPSARANRWGTLSLWRGGGTRAVGTAPRGGLSGIALDVVAAWVSFFLGHAVGEWLHWELARLGPLNLFPAFLATILGLIAASALVGPEKAPGPRWPRRPSGPRA